MKPLKSYIIKEAKSYEEIKAMPEGDINDLRKKYKELEAYFQSLPNDDPYWEPFQREDELGVNCNSIYMQYRTQKKAAAYKENPWPEYNPRWKASYRGRAKKDTFTGEVVIGKHNVVAANYVVIDNVDDFENFVKYCIANNLDKKYEGFDRFVEVIDRCFYWKPDKAKAAFCIYKQGNRVGITSEQNLWADWNKKATGDPLASTIGNAKKHITNVEIPFSIFDSPEAFEEFVNNAK